MTDFSDTRRLLEARAAELEQRLAHIEARIHHTEAPPDKDSAEQAIEREDDDVVTTLGFDTRAQLRAIRKAIARIDSGDYGVCSACGADIALARLAALPWTEHCVACAERLERGR